MERLFFKKKIENKCHFKSILPNTRGHLVSFAFHSPLTFHFSELLFLTFFFIKAETILPYSLLPVALSSCSFENIDHKRTPTGSCQDIYPPTHIWMIYSAFPPAAVDELYLCS